MIKCSKKKTKTKTKSRVGVGDKTTKVFKVRLIIIFMLFTY